MINHTHQVFLSYASEDVEKVVQLYEKLLDAGFKPWMDKKNILLGERWENSIWKAVRHSNIFLACLSNKSITKRGFLQKELRHALNIWEEKLEDDIYFIPVRLEECEIPERLRGFEWVNLFEENGWELLVRALRASLDTFSTYVLDVDGITIEARSISANVVWHEMFGYGVVTGDGLGDALFICFDRGRSGRVSEIKHPHNQAI